MVRGRARGVADAISQFITWTYEQNPEVNRDEVLEAFGKAVTVDSVVEKVNDPVLHISAREPVSDEAKDYHQSELAYRG